jgi:hypothetical protein
MVALAQYIPNDPDEKASVLHVLREHPEVQEFVVQASEKAKELFPEVSIQLDATRFDDWDPPVTMTIRVLQPWSAFNEANDRFMNWLSYHPDYQRDLLLVMPMWDGPIETLS